MEVTNALKKLRDDLKAWTTNNILSLKTYVDKTKFSGSYNDLTNKPCYDTRETEVIEITFDGNTEGKESTTDDNGNIFFKVSDMVFTEEQINMLKNDSDAIFSVTTGSTGSSDDYKIVDMGGVTDGEGVYFIDTVIVIATEGNEELGFTPGVWFFKADYGYADRLRFSSATGELKQIEEKFIPELDYNGLRNKPLVVKFSKTFKYDADMEEKVTCFAPTFGCYCGVKVADVTAEETTMYIEAATKNGCIITYEKDGVITEDVSKITRAFMSGSMGIATSDGTLAVMISPEPWEWYYAHNNQYVKEPGVYLVDDQIFDDPNYSHLNLTFRVLKIEILGIGELVYESEKDIYVNEDKLATEVYVDNAINNIPEGFSGDYNDLENRPCYDDRVIDTVTLEFDGNTEGLLTGGNFISVTNYVRISEDVEPFDVERLNATNTIVCRTAEGENVEFKGTFLKMFSNVYYLSGENNDFGNDIVFILSDMDFHAPSIHMDKGIWFYNNGDRRVESLSYEKVISGDLEVLDAKYLVNSPGIKKDNGAEIFNDYANNVATGQYSHAEGSWTQAKGKYSHAEGGSCQATGDQSHAEGLSTIAEGKGSHAEGWGCQSDGEASHAEGNYTRAEGQYSHAEGNYSKAKGMNSHAEGDHTTASGDNQHVQGKWNIEDTENKYAHIVGNGTYQTPANIHTLDWNGNAWFAGKVTAEGTPVNDNDLVNKSYVDNTYLPLTGGLVTGNVQIDGNLVNNNDATFNKQVTFNDMTTLGAGANLAGNAVHINADSLVNNSPSTHNNTATFNGEITFNNNVTFGEDAVLSGNKVQIDANTLVNNAVSTHNKAATFNGNATFNSPTTLGAGANLAGDKVQINADALVNNSPSTHNQAATFNGETTFNSPTTLGAGANLAGNEVQINANALVNNAVSTHNQAATFNNTVVFNEQVTFSQDLNIASIVSVAAETGDAWFNGKITAEGTPVNEKDLTTKAYVDNNIKTVSDELAKQKDKNVSGSLANGITQAFAAISTNQGRLNNHDAKIAHFESQFSIINGEGVGSIKKAVSDLVDSAPDAMNTLNELANAISNHATEYDAYVATVSNALAGKAPASHGTHLELGTTSSTAFRGDYGNTAYNHSQAAHAPSNAQKNSDITKAEIEAKLTGAITSHTHNYAGSSSAGGAATSANKVNNNLVVKLNSGTIEGTNQFTFNGSAGKTINITPSAVGLSGLSSYSSMLCYEGSGYDAGGSRVSLGCDNTVTGAISIGLGEENKVTGNNSLVLGKKNSCTTHNTFMIGIENEVIYSNGTEWAYSFLFGERNRIGFKEGESAGNLSTDAEAAYGSVALGQYNQVGYKCAVMGDSNRAKYYGYAIGANCNACNYSLAIGTYCNALSKFSTAVGSGAYAGGGDYASAFGYYCRAEASYALAMGNSAYARKYKAIAVGGHAEEEESLAIGNYAYAYSKCSAALTPYTYATGENAVCIGRGAVTQAKNAIAIGYQTKIGETGEGVTAMGHFNDADVTGCSTGTTGTALVIGNGASDDARSNACRITFAGAVIGKAAYQSSGADYAEYFEWLDGNTDSEDRRGYFVTMDGNKIKKAKEGDYILGIVSAYPAVVGNNDMEWSGKFLLDEFGDPIKKVQKTIIKEHELIKDVHFTDEEMQTLTYEERKQREMKIVEKEVECEYFVLNPDFDPDREYVHRADRPEWDTIGMMGVLAVYDDGTCEVNGFCKCNNEGIATACEKGCDSYRVIKRVNENIVQIVFR